MSARESRSRKGVGGGVAAVAGEVRLVVVPAQFTTVTLTLTLSHYLAYLPANQSTRPSSSTGNLDFLPSFPEFRRISFEHDDHLHSCCQLCRFSWARRRAPRWCTPGIPGSCSTQTKAPPVRLRPSPSLSSLTSFYSTNRKCQCLLLQYPLVL